MKLMVKTCILLEALQFFVVIGAAELVASGVTFGTAELAVSCVSFGTAGCFILTKKMRKNAISLLFDVL